MRLYRKYVENKMTWQYVWFYLFSEFMTSILPMNKILPYLQYEINGTPEGLPHSPSFFPCIVQVTGRVAPIPPVKMFFASRVMVQGEEIGRNSLFFLGSCNELLFYLSVGHIFITTLKYMLLHPIGGYTTAEMPDKGSWPFGSEEVL